MPTTIRLTGHDAIRYAEIHGVALHKYTDPIEKAREELSIEEARQVAAEDPSLIWVDANIYEIRLPEACYEPRRTLGGGTVRDVVPYEGATAYVTDGFRYGIQYEDGYVDWLGNDPVRAFGEDVVGFYGTDYATYYVSSSGRIWLVQSDEDDPATLPREIDRWNYEAVPCDDLVGSDYPELLRGVEE